MIDRYSPPDGVHPIYIADRGFHSFNVFAHAIEQNAFFLIRMKDINTERLLGYDLSEQSDTFDVHISRILTRSQSRKKRQHPELEDQYRYICPSVVFDYIEPKKKPEYHISLRILRFKISDNGYENIITNLPEESFSMEEIKMLYNMRWGIETSFRELKHTIGAMNFHSKQREYIEMEIWARLLLYNFCSIITKHIVIEKKGRKYDYQVNYRIAYNLCHRFLGLHNAESPPDIESLIEKNILPIRLKRKYPIQHRFRVPASFNYRFS